MSLVVYWCEHLRDGTEEGAKVVSNVTEALTLIEKLVSGFGGCNTTVRLFHLGKEIPLEREEVEIPKTTVEKVVRYRMKGGKVAEIDGTPLDGAAKSPLPLPDRVKALRYYVPDDEGGYLFQKTCCLCYHYYGNGGADKAEILYQWAKELAEGSAEWCLQEGRILEEEDSVLGSWGG